MVEFVGVYSEDRRFPWFAACDVGEHQSEVDLRGEKNPSDPTHLRFLDLFVVFLGCIVQCPVQTTECL